MNTILKLPPYPCTSITLSIFSDSCFSEVTSCPPHLKFHLFYKPNLLKNGPSTSRLHYIGCTSFEKNSTNDSPTENLATEKHLRELENFKDLDRRNQVSIDDANLVDFVNGSEPLEELSEANLDKNGIFEVNQGSQCSGFDVGNAENAIRGNGYEKNEKLGDLCDINFGNCEKNVNLTYLSDKNNGSDRFTGMDKKNQLGRSILDENSANLVYFSDGIGVSDKCDSTAENEMDGRHENGFDRSNTMDKRYQLGSSVLDEINANLVDSSDKFIENCDSGVRKDGEALCVKGSEKEELDNAIIRKVWSPFSSDPIKAKKDKGLLNDEEMQKLKILENFVYDHSFDHGHLMVKLMATEHMEEAKEVLTDSFTEFTWGPLTYRPLLRLIFTAHIVERRSFLPHAATLVGLYAEREGEWILGGTVELFFNAKGADELPPTPTPPERSPYLCNIAVNKNLRRRGIGRHLLKASEKLVPQMGLNEIYLHCRVIDTAPFNMYVKAGYKVVQTDNIFALLTLQRRRHLMYKKLPLPS